MRNRILAIGMLIIGISCTASAQTYTFETYGREIDHAMRVTPIPELGQFGESTNYASGVTTFRKTVVSLPGSNRLRVAADYTMRLFNAPGSSPHYIFERDLPYIEGTHSWDYGWIAGYAPTNYNRNRCSDPSALSNGAATIRIIKPLDNILPTDYWDGNSLYTPDAGGGIVRPISSEEPRPTGTDIKWATNDGWRFSCYVLPDGSEGFIGYRQNGEKYYFGIPVAMGQGLQILSPNRPDVDGWLDVDKFRMYVTRIEDHLGNWVNYGPDQITSSDGRTITFASAPSSGTTIAANGRQWSISGNMAGLSIANPDGSSWSFAAQGTIGIGYSNDLFSCAPEASIPSQYSGQLTVTVKTEAGATGVFVFQPRRRGFSQVPFDCKIIGIGSKEGYYYSTTMHFLDEVALVSRTVSGPGLNTFSHSINYGPVNACYSPTSTPNQPDVCTANSPGVRTTTITGSDGRTRTLAFGNAYYVNAGVLLSETEGNIQSTSLENILLYQNLQGSGKRVTGYDVTSTDIFRVRKKITILQGKAFTTEVPSTCGTGNSPCFDNYFRPTKIIRSSAPNP